ncbi:MAG: motility protein [Microbacteriaceae bacterium]|nr:MAG: motility protein [Microbacteriaceae bacterium]
MIVLTRLNGSQFAINPDLVERIVENPDTTITLVDGSNHIVTESLERVIALITEFRADVVARASVRRAEFLSGQRHLEAVPNEADDARNRRERKPRPS